MSVQTSTASSRAGRRAVLIPLVLAVAVLVPVVSFASPATGAAGDDAGPPVAESAARRAGSADRANPGTGSRSLADRQISMDEAIDLARRRYNARVVRAEVSERDGRRVYLLRLLSDDGRVFNVRVDAATGSIQ